MAPFSSFAIPARQSKGQACRTQYKKYPFDYRHLKDGADVAIFDVEVNMSKSLQIGLLSLCLTVPTYAATHHRDVKVVDVNAHAVPPLPSSRHVVVVNSAQNARRHHDTAARVDNITRR